MTKRILLMAFYLVLGLIGIAVSMNGAGYAAEQQLTVGTGLIWAGACMSFGGFGGFGFQTAHLAIELDLD
jgi:hypothetical protein